MLAFGIDGRQVYSFGLALLFESSVGCLLLNKFRLGLNTKDFCLSLGFDHKFLCICLRIVDGCDSLSANFIDDDLTLTLRLGKEYSCLLLGLNLLDVFLGLGLQLILLLVDIGALNLLLEFEEFSFILPLKCSQFLVLIIAQVLKFEVLVLFMILEFKF